MGKLGDFFLRDFQDDGAHVRVLMFASPEISWIAPCFIRDEFGERQAISLTIASGSILAILRVKHRRALKVCARKPENVQTHYACQVYVETIELWPGGWYPPHMPSLFAIYTSRQNVSMRQ